MKTLKIKKGKYDRYMDKSMIPLCDVLNSMHGIVTEESCEGHGKDVTDIWFSASDFVSLAKIQRAIDRRYGSLRKRWRLETVTTDSPLRGHPPMVFWLHSDEPYTKEERVLMIRDMAIIALNIKLYHTDYFNEYFLHPNKKHGSIPDDVWNEFREEARNIDLPMKRYDERMKSVEDNVDHNRK